MLVVSRPVLSLLCGMLCLCLSTVAVAEDKKASEEKKAAEAKEPAPKLIADVQLEKSSARN